MDALLGRTSTRFLVVTLLPNLLLVFYVGFLLAAGAADHDPQLASALHALNDLTWRELVFGLFLVVGTAVVLHPVQYPLIQILEGYWLNLPFGAMASEWATHRYHQHWLELRAVEREASEEDVMSSKHGSAAGAQLDWMPTEPAKLLPTSLGNTLRAGEERAGSRYGLDIGILLPRLFPLMRPEVRDQLNERRNQLDAAARVCIVALVACLVSIVLLVPGGHWLLVPFATFIVAWVSYRAAVAAAKGYCIDMAAAVDLHHRDFWRAFELQPPANLEAEIGRGAIVSAVLAGRDHDPGFDRTVEWRDPPSTPSS